MLYTDGEQFARYHFGKRSGPVAQLTPSLQRAGSALRVADGAFERTLADFLLWEPEHPRLLSDLVRITSSLCRLLRDDVNTEIALEYSGLATSRTFTELAADWRQVLFPNLTDREFADQYAQTVAFALLLARVEGVSFAGRSISEIARLLGKKHSLMGRALTVLTDQPEEQHSVALTTMIRVLGAVDWSRFPDDSFSMLYEDFLAAPRSSPTLSSPARRGSRARGHRARPAQPPHHADRAAHDAALEVLMPAADAVLTLTIGAALRRAQRTLARRDHLPQHDHHRGRPSGLRRVYQGRRAARLRQRAVDIAGVSGAYRPLRPRPTAAGPATPAVAPQGG